MAVTTDTVVLPITPMSRKAVLTAAEVAFSAPTNVVDVLTAADNINGARISQAFAIPRAAIAAANNVQLYERDGTTYTLIDSAVMPVVTPSAGVANPKTDFGFTVSSPMEVKAGVGIAAAMGQAVGNGVVVVLRGALY